jgi:hypothetical protein
MSEQHTILVRIEVSELIHMDSTEFDEVVDARAATQLGGGGVLSAYDIVVEGVENDSLLVLRVSGFYEKND